VGVKHDNLVKEEERILREAAMKYKRRPDLYKETLLEIVDLDLNGDMA
jgi:hypothetical protein